MMSASFASKYKVIQKIGEGSFSEVLKCEDKQSGTQYAAKRLKKIFKTISDVMGCAEIIAMHKLSRHPNVLYMIEYFYEPGNGKLVYVFELMDMSMYEFMKMRKRCLPEVKVRNYLYQMLKGLEHLHKNGLFHRDVKPENVLIKLLNPTNNFVCHQVEVVKLADLGSIRGIYSQPPYTEYISTRWYRSPECLLSVGYYGPKMDVWAAGCVFYEMLTLKPLFPGTNEIDQLAKIHAILGSPTPRLLNRIKKKSHNCETFPRQLGSGLNALICNFSEDARQVMKLMIHYDPENRINVRRLVEHRYFASLREQYLLSQVQCTTRFGGELQSKGRGDHMSYVSNSFGSAEKSSQNKYYSVTPKSTIKTEQACRIRKSPLVSSKTSSDMNGYNTATSKKYTLRDGSGPLVTQRQIQDWGVDPTILKRKDSAPKIFKDAKHRNAGHHQKRRLRESNPFRKTMSNLPVSKQGPEEPRAVASPPRRQQQFQSKSFVLPRRVAGRFKLDTINETKAPIMSKLINKHDL